MPVVDQVPRRSGRLAPALPWLSTGVVLVAALVAGHTPVADIARYALYWTLAVLLPGTLVHRALRGSRGNLPEDLGYGAVVGLLLELGCWTLTAATGQQSVLRWWPVPVVAGFVAVPALRRHWRGTRSAPLPLSAAWSLAGVLAVVTGLVALRWSTTPLPPVTFDYHQDLLYHLGLVQELRRSMPFQVPQLAGEPLRYHYLGNAHMAGASLVSGVSPVTVLLRLWMVPVVFAAVLGTAALARELTGRWWAGPLAAAGSYLGLPLTLGAPAAAMGGSPVAYVSPSQTYAMPFAVLLVVLCVDVLRAKPLRAGWLLVPALGLVCAGAKASALPPILAGLLLSATVVGWRRRRVPAPVLATIGTLITCMVVGGWLFSGGGAGTLDLQAFSVLRWTAPYRKTLGADDGISSGGLLPAGLATADAAGWLFALGVAVWWLLMQTPRWLGLAGVANPRLRADPAVWLLGGVVGAGAAASWLLFHPSASQVYFFIGVVPFGVLLSVCLLADARARPLLLAGAVAAGAAITWSLPGQAPPDDTPSAWAWALALPTLRAFAAGVALGVLVGVGHGIRQRSPVRRWPGRPGGTVTVALATAAVLGGSVAAGVNPLIGRMTSDAPAVTPAPEHLAVTAAEIRAALWLDAHAGQRDVVATNVHCQPVRTTAACDARAFWVVGFGGRRSVVESWGYSDAAVASHGRGGLSYPRQGPPDPELFAVNERVFTAATRADLDWLRRRHDVRWLFADVRAGPVSPALAELASVRLVAGPVTIYELP